MAKRKQHPNSLKNLTMWEPGQSGNPNGRPKSRFNQIKEQLELDTGMRMTKHEVYELIKTMVSYSEVKLEEIHIDKELPVYMRTIAKAILNDLEHGRLSNIEVIFNRVYGTPTVHTEITGKDGGALQHTDLTDEELEARIKKLKEATK